MDEMLTQETLETVGVSLTEQGDKRKTQAQIKDVIVSCRAHTKTRKYIHVIISKRFLTLILTPHGTRAV
jgi:hypothetical protein